MKKTRIKKGDTLEPGDLLMTQGPWWGYSELGVLAVVIRSTVVGDQWPRVRVFLPHRHAHAPANAFWKVS